jgi:hypothetical protein
VNFKSYFQDLARYHKWAYDILYTSLEQISENDYRKDYGLFFGSIHQTLNPLSCFAGEGGPSEASGRVRARQLSDSESFNQSLPDIHSQILLSF